MNLKHIKSTFLRQQGQNDCGVACLCSIIKFHGGEASPSKIRLESGTLHTGTTMLGLYQAATTLGFDAEGLEAGSVDDLKSLQHPAILSVLTKENQPHYLIYYGFKEEHIVIGDPATGITTYSKDELENVWKEKTLLTLQPTECFNKKQEVTGKLQLLQSLIKQDLPLLYITLAIGVITATLDLSSAIFSQRLIDDFLPAHNMQKIVISLVLLIVLLFCKTSLNYLRGLFVVKQSKDFSIRIIDHFYSSLIRLPKIFFDSAKTGELISRMNDTSKIQSTLQAITGSITISVLILFASIILLSSYSVVFAVVILLFLPIYSIVLLHFNNTIAASQRAVMSNYGQAEANYIDSIQGITTIKNTSGEGWFSNLNKRIYTLLQDSIFRLGQTHNRYIFIADSLGVLFITCMLGTAAWLVLNNELKTGELVATLAVAVNISPLVTRILLGNIQIQEALAALDRMNDITSNQKEFDENKPRDEDHPLNALSLSIEARNIAFRFTGREQLLKDISFHVRQGEIITITGESGGGKSTILQILQRFYKPERGTITVSGILLNQIPIPTWRSHTAVVPQEVKIFNGTLLYNIALSTDPDKASSAIQFCVEYGFDKFFRSLPQGYSTLIGEDGINLSGGQKQILAFARALVQIPKLLLIDEGMASMDSKTEKFIIDLLLGLKKRMATVIISHRLNITAYSDRTYLLKDGCI
ncbi:peptidase domain-containing ABC transporter [Ohtaekwangia koreensis]|uniref:ATP-binding cassette, subfamily B n=1 Tax=Ohtaekwangia koreensis TaxID=688867 RepID=A0A1T5J936_9BACT|nr:peptidase domain-containing ABC transporter [Ohtaekwangia koreensis]SKC47758.1 ATP-binding cassette, subfamily B [Ohtaekwangia koreensis]